MAYSESIASSLYPWQVSQWQKIQSQLSADKLPHALLLSGKEGLGKRAFAEALAHSLLCQQPTDNGTACGACAACQLLAAHTHPDLLLLQAEEAGKALKVDEVRELSSRLQFTSQFGGYKVALVVDAHDMNINAANSLLKTLEEPAQRSVLILVSSRAEKLPITVRSRCQRILFNEPDEALAVDWLRQQGVEDSAQLLRLAHGAPLLAQQLKNGELYEQHQQLIKSLLALAANQPLLAQAELLHKLPLAYLLNWLYDWVEDLIKLHQCGEQGTLVHETYRRELSQLVPRSSLPALYEYLEQLLKQKQLQSIPLNSQLLWEDLLLSWARQLKRV